MLNYVSHHPFHMKLNVAKSLFRRVLLLSDKPNHHKNMEIVRNLLRKNNYPENLIQKWGSEMINCLADKGEREVGDNVSSIIENNNVGESNSDSGNRVINVDKNNSENGNRENNENKVLYHVGITYVKGMSESIQKQLGSKNQKAGIAHRNSNSLKGIYNKVKERIPKMKRSEIVYKIPCAGGEENPCNGCYVGTTGRMLGDRMKEHAADVAKKRRNTALVDHVLDEKHFFDFNKVSILSHEPDYRKRMIKEGCHITVEDSVNYRTDTNNISKLYHDILNKLQK